MNDNIDYENEPFYYCKNCMSLNIKVEGDIDYCDDCGSLEVVKSNNMDKWVKTYKKLYNIEYYGREPKERTYRRRAKKQPSSGD